MMAMNSRGLDVTTTDDTTIPEVGYLITRYTDTSPSALSLPGDRKSTYTYFGPLLPLSPLPEDLQTWSTKTIAGDFLSAIKTFLEYVHSYLSQHFPEYRYYWFEIRATKGSHDFVLPRWHSDGRFFTHNRDGCEWKFATCLLGPGTLFLKNGVEAREIERAEEQQMHDELDGLDFEDNSARENESCKKQQEIREVLAKRFDGWERIQPKLRDVVRFRVGEGDAGMHSEPDSRGDRIFVSVLPGMEEELKDLAERWGMPWSRALE